MTRFPIIHRAIVSERRLGQKILIVFAAIAAATALRLSLAYFTITNLPFATYFPAVLICSLLAGWRFGFACAVLSGIVAEVLFPSAGTTVAVSAVRFPLVDFLIFLAMSSIIIATADTLRRVARDLDHARETSSHLTRELQHRVTNTLAVVHGLAMQSFKAGDPETFLQVFGERLQALGRAHRLLATNELETCALPELIEEACSPFNDGKNIALQGAAYDLPAASCIPLVLGIHELCTNAVKHGALSDRTGKVEISWGLGDVPGRLVIDWQETGGPRVSPPKRKGLGSVLLRRQPGIADVSLSFETTGLCCRLSVDGAKAREPAGSDTPAEKRFAG